MLTCITCSKQTDEKEEEGTRGTPSSKQSVKSLTAQLKDIALKFSGSNRQCKPGTGTGIYKAGQQPYPEFDTISESVPYSYFQAGSSSSTPAWDFSSTGHRATRPDSRFSGVLTGDQNPAGRESISAQSDVMPEDDQPREWMAQVEPGVHITFVSLPSGGNDLKRIRFSREIFDKWQAQQWWGENFDRIIELYNVQRFNHQALYTPSRSEEERDSSFSRFGSARESPIGPSSNKDWTPWNNYRASGSKGYLPSDPPDHSASQHYYPPRTSSHYGVAGTRGEDASWTTTTSRDEASVSISNGSDMENEWVEEDEPGVYITIRQLADGTRELRRVRFSRERFGESRAKQWWEGNRDRIQEQYL